MIFTAGPMLASLYLSFTDYNVIRAPELVGLENYEQLMRDRRIPLSLGNTLIYAVLHVPLLIIISLFLRRSWFGSAAPPALSGRPSICRT